MANLINIKKGLQIPLQGASEEVLRGSVTSEFVRICPEDFHGITPKLAVKVDDRVKAGNALFYAKDHPEILFASPVSGVVTEVERGEKRRILNIVIKADNEIEYEDFGVKKVTSLSPEEIKKSILDAGMWFLIKQRPYDVVAVPDKQPRDIFITGFDTAPLAPSYDFILEGQEADIQTVLDAVANDLIGEAGGNDKLSTHLDSQLALIQVDDGTGTDQNVGAVLSNSLDALGSAGSTEGDFHSVDTAGSHSVGQRNRILNLLQNNNGNNDGLCESFHYSHDNKPPKILAYSVCFFTDH